jgi:hypothetical protein
VVNGPEPPAPPAGAHAMNEIPIARPLLAILVSLTLVFALFGA